MLEIHQPQVGLDGDSRSSNGTCEAVYERFQETVVVEEGSTLVSSSDRTLASAGSTASNNSDCPSHSRSIWMTSC